MMYPFYFKRPFNSYKPYYSPKPPRPHIPVKIVPDEPVQECKKEKTQTGFFEILGFKLYYDDLIIIGLIFLLLEEEINDKFLFIFLILLIGD